MNGWRTEAMTTDDYMERREFGTYGSAGAFGGCATELTGRSTGRVRTRPAGEKLRSCSPSGKPSCQSAYSPPRIPSESRIPTWPSLSGTTTRPAVGARWTAWSLVWHIWKSSSDPAGRCPSPLTV